MRLGNRKFRAEAGGRLSGLPPPGGHEPSSDQLRRVQARQRTESLADPHDEIGVSPLDHAIAMETFERYEAALSRLSTEEQEAIIGRVEMENTYDELAKNLGKPSGDAARMAVTRARVSLAEEMQRGAQR